MKHQEILDLIERTSRVEEDAVDDETRHERIVKVLRQMLIMKSI